MQSNTSKNLPNGNKIERLRTVSRKLIRELGMLEVETPGHWHSLIEVAKQPGITISELGRLLLMSVSTISRVVKSLGKRGFVDFKEGSDKREKALFLTARGMKEVEKIDAFSDAKIIGAFEFLKDDEIEAIIQAIAKYEEALEKSRRLRDNVKIHTLSTSRTLRKQIVNMITNIQKNEFLIPVTPDINAGIVKAENEYYYYNSYNFWYAVNEEGTIVGSAGLKKIDAKQGEIKKFFVSKEYRGKGVAQKLMQTLLKAASKHEFEVLILGTTDKFHAAHKFYEKCGFAPISRKDLPKAFEQNPFDSLFFRKKLD